MQQRVAIKNVKNRTIKPTKQQTSYNLTFYIQLHQSINWTMGMDSYFIGEGVQMVNRDFKRQITSLAMEETQDTTQ